MTTTNDTGINDADPRALRSRASLVEALWAHLAEGGGTPSITDVVKRAGVSRPTFYQHFADVPDLVRAATLQRLGCVFDRMPSDPHGDSWDDFARARLTVIFGELQGDADIYLPILQGPAAVPVLAGIIHFLADQFLHHSPLGGPLRDGVDEREAQARAEFLGAGAVWRAIDWLSSDFTGDNALEPTVQRFAANILAASGAANYPTTDTHK